MDKIPFDRTKFLNSVKIGDWKSYMQYDLRGADLIGANLSRANLSGANLSGADLRWADLDFSVLPLWCGSLGMKVDKRIAAQIAYHFCALDCNDAEYIKARNAIVDFANQFHRVDECGKLQKIEKENDNGQV